MKGKKIHLWKWFQTNIDKHGVNEGHGKWVHFAITIWIIESADAKSQKTFSFSFIELVFFHIFHPAQIITRQSNSVKTKTLLCTQHPRLLAKKKYFLWLSNKRKWVARQSLLLLRIDYFYLMHCNMQNLYVECNNIATRTEVKIKIYFRLSPNTFNTSCIRATFVA